MLQARGGYQGIRKGRGIGDLVAQPCQKAAPLHDELHSCLNQTQHAIGTLGQTDVYD